MEENKVTRPCKRELIRIEDANDAFFRAIENSIASYGSTTGDIRGGGDNAPVRSNMGTGS